MSTADALEGRRTIVTGGASGIGRAGAIALAARGARVIVADIDAAGAAGTCDTIRAGGADARPFAYDAADSASANALVAHAATELGGLDLLVHCAGICPRRPFLDMDDDEWRRVLSVNLDGTFFVTRAAARVMATQRSGSMVLVTSDRGVHGSIDYAHYAASKGGMIALVKSLALSMGRYGVTVNGINPGLTDTPLGRAANPQWADKMAIDVLGRVSEPHEVAEMILFLAGPGAAFMTGQIMSARMRYGA